MTTTNQELHLIQAYRALAFLLVVLFHGAISVKDRYGQAPFDDFFRFGFSGVFLFFVISGFIISYAHRNDVGSRKVLHYLLRRIVRIYPFYWFVFLFIGTWRWWSGTIEIPDLITNALFFYAQKTWVIPVSWTMHWEMMFYLVFTSFIISLRLGVATILLWIFANAFMAETGFWGLLDPINVLFILGLCASLLVIVLMDGASGTRNGIGIFSILLGGALFMIAIKYYFDAGSPSSWPNDRVTLMGFGFASFFLMLACLSPALNAMAAQLQVISLIGNASYSIYLTHVQFERLAMDIINQLMKRIGGSVELSGNVLLVASVATAIVGGILLHQKVEKPLLNMLRVKINRLSSVTES